MSASYKMLPQLVSPSAQSVRAAQRSVGARRVALFETTGADNEHGARGATIKWRRWPFA